MERIIITSRSYLLHVGSDLYSTLRTWFFIVFPFLQYPKDLVQFEFNFENKSDYLYLSERMSTKKYIYPETISLALTCIVIFSLYIYGLMQLFAIPFLVALSASIAFFYAIFLASLNTIIIPIFKEKENKRRVRERE